MGLGIYTFYPYTVRLLFFLAGLDRCGLGKVDGMMQSQRRRNGGTTFWRRGCGKYIGHYPEHVLFNMLL